MFKTNWPEFKGESFKLLSFANKTEQWQSFHNICNPMQWTAILFLNVLINFG